MSFIACIVYCMYRLLFIACHLLHVSFIIYCMSFIACIIYYLYLCTYKNKLNI